MAAAGAMPVKGAPQPPPPLPRRLPEPPDPLLVVLLGLRCVGDVIMLLGALLLPE